MVARFLAPDLTQLAPAKLIEEIDAEAILAAQKAFVLARWAEVRQKRPDLPPLDTLGLETEPLTILLEAFAYRETLLRALAARQFPPMSGTFCGSRCLLPTSSR